MTVDKTERADEARKMLEDRINEALWLQDKEGGKAGRELAAEEIAKAVEEYTFTVIGITRGQ